MKIYAYTIRVHPPEKGEKSYWVEVPALPGCFTVGKTHEEVIANAREAIQCYIEGLIHDGEAVPEEADARALSKEGGELAVAVPVMA